MNCSNDSEVIAHNKLFSPRSRLKAVPAQEQRAWGRPPLWSFVVETPNFFRKVLFRRVATASLSVMVATMCEYEEPIQAAQSLWGSQPEIQYTCIQRTHVEKRRYWSKWLKTFKWCIWVIKWVAFRGERMKDFLFWTSSRPESYVKHLSFNLHEPPKYILRRTIIHHLSHSVMSAFYDLKTQVQPEALAWDITSNLGADPSWQPWREFWPPKNIDSLHPDDLVAKPWMTWKRDMDKRPNDKPWYYWVNVFEGEVDEPCGNDGDEKCKHCDGKGCVRSAITSTFC